MSKRIFSDKHDQLPTSNILRTPNCYYHKQPITYFCTKKKCTLPLCNECLPIHRRQHINDKQIAMEGIIQFQKAQGDSLSAFAQRKGEIQNTQQQFKGKILDYRNKIVEVIDKLLDRFFQDCLITDGNIDILKQIQERTSEIKGGSLKQLIRYYEDTYGAQHFRKLYKMYNGQYLTNFKFEINKTQIEQLTRKGIINTSLPYQNGQMAKTLVIKNDQQKLNQQIKHILQPVKNNGINNEIKPNYIVNNKIKQYSSEQDLQSSEISSYKLLKTKKGTMNTNEQNIYTQQISKVVQPLSSIPSSNESHGSRSKSKKKKGLSLAKSHAFLTLHSDNSMKDQNQKNQQNIQRRQNWRNFVNMGQIHPHQKSHDRLMIGRQEVSEPKTLLNPKQMRDLIVKKKMQEKNKGQKQIQANKSRELVEAISSKNLRP